MPSAESCNKKKCVIIRRVQYTKVRALEVSLQKSRVTPKPSRALCILRKWYAWVQNGLGLGDPQQLRGLHRALHSLHTTARPAAQPRRGTTCLLLFFEMQALAEKISASGKNNAGNIVFGRESQCPVARLFLFSSKSHAFISAHALKKTPG